MTAYAPYRHIGRRVRSATGIEGVAYSQRGARILIKTDRGLRWADWSKVIVVDSQRRDSMAKPKEPKEGEGDNGPDLTEEDEQLLDEAWRKIASEGLTDGEDE